MKCNSLTVNKTSNFNAVITIDLTSDAAHANYINYCFISNELN